MTDEEKIQAFTQEVYLTKYGRQIDDITDVDGQEEITKTIIWTNLFLDELEAETRNDGQPIDWSFLRENDKEVGTIATASQTFPLPTGVNRLVVTEDRPLAILQGSSIISTWDVVDPNQITRQNNSLTRDKRVTVVNSTIIFSRELDDTEIGGTVIADVINDMPELASDDTEVLDLVGPRQLLVLGVAKNSTLPDIVQGGLSPSYVQKYDDVLEQAKMKNEVSSKANEAGRDNFSFVGGVY